MHRHGDGLCYSHRTPGAWRHPANALALHWHAWHENLRQYISWRTAICSSSLETMKLSAPKCSRASFSFLGLVLITVTCKPNACHPTTHFAKNHLNRNIIPETSQGQTPGFRVTQHPECN